MKKIMLAVMAFAGLALSVTPARAQSVTTTKIQPDCIQYIWLTAAGSNAVIDNRQVGCIGWVMSYNSYGFSVVSLALQSAPSLNATSPGSFVTFAGTTVNGTNPGTSTTQATWTGTGYYPWLRVTASGLTGTGTISGVLYGWKNAADAISASGGGGSTVVQYNNGQANPSPIVVNAMAGQDGANIRALLTDTGGRIVNANTVLNGSGTRELVYIATLNTFNNFGPGPADTVQLIAATPGQSIRIASLVAGLGAANTADFMIQYGTGTNCGTGNNTVVQFGNSPVSVSYPVQGWLVIPAGNAVCIASGDTMATMWNINVIYAKF